MKNKTRHVVFLAALLAGCVISAGAQKLGPRVSDAVTGVSVEPPAGWISKLNDKSETVIHESGGGGFAANMNFKSEKNAWSLTDYANVGTKYILDHYKDIGTDSTTLVSRTSFTTAKKVAGIRAIFVSVFKGFTVRSTQYYFAGSGDNRYIVTFTALDADNKVNDKLFDKSAKTFTIDK